MTDDGIPSERRPIGFWLKLVDRLIDARLDETPAGDGLTRRHWQTLNVISQGAATTAEIDERLRPFLSPLDYRTTIAVLERMARNLGRET